MSDCRPITNLNRVILHVDMDAFYAAVEELHNPEIKSKPVIVGSDPKQGKGRGVVSTCNYKAREYGIHSAMPISQAWKLCPQGVYVQPHFSLYKKVSDQIMNIFSSFSPIVEPVSIDEAYLDCSGMERIYSVPLLLAQELQDTIYKETGLSASIGIAPNKYIAKIASDLNKPKGICICPPGHEKNFLADLPVSRLWGAGKKTIQLLKSKGYHRIGQISAADSHEISRILGRRGEQLHQLACGIDIRVVQSHWHQKTISEEVTFHEDTNDQIQLQKTLQIISEELGYKIRKKNMYYKTIRIKVRDYKFNTYTRSLSLQNPDQIAAQIYEHSVALFNAFIAAQKFEGRKIRLIGIALCNLVDASKAAVQLDLFDSYSSDNHFTSAKRESLLDQLKDKFPQKIGIAATINQKLYSH